MFYLIFLKDGFCFWTDALPLGLEEIKANIAFLMAVFNNLFFCGCLRVFHDPTATLCGLDEAQY